jgi:hypothetical protein
MVGSHRHQEQFEPSESIVLDRVNSLRHRRIAGDPEQQRKRSIRNLSKWFGFDQLGHDVSIVLNQPEWLADTVGKSVEAGEV